MEVETFDIEGLMLITPKVFGDERGFFMESYNKKAFAEIGIDIDFVQDNHSRSAKNILRGLHFQKPPHAQDKLVRVTSGSVLDVAVDIRPDSATYGQHVMVELTAENKKMFLVPKGFAHGFLVTSDSADFLYKTSDYYSPECDSGLLWNDTDLAINWPTDKPILSEKDLHQQKFADFTSPF